MPPWRKASSVSSRVRWQAVSEFNRRANLHGLVGRTEGAGYDPFSGIILIGKRNGTRLGPLLAESVESSFPEVIRCHRWNEVNGRIKVQQPRFRDLGNLRRIFQIHD